MSGPTDWIRYNGTGLVCDFTSGHRLGEISVYYNSARDVFQMWGSRVYYFDDEPEKPSLYPGPEGADFTTITSVRIGYAESLDGVNYTFLGDAIPSSYDGLDISTDKNYGRSVIRVAPDGTYHLLAGLFGHSPSNGVVYNFDYYTSPTGIAGSWTFIGSVLNGEPLGNAGDIIWDNGKVHVFYDSFGGGKWAISYASGPDLLHLTKYSGNPILSDGKPCLGDACIVKAGSRWIMLHHDSVPGGSYTPTQGHYHTLDAVNIGPTGWVDRGLFLPLTNFSDAIGSPAQIGDLFIVEAKGQTYLYWSENLDQSGLQPTLYFAMATQPATLEQIFGAIPSLTRSIFGRGGRISPRMAGIAGSVAFTASDAPLSRRSMMKYLTCLAATISLPDTPIKKAAQKLLIMCLLVATSLTANAAQLFTSPNYKINSSATSIATSTDILASPSYIMNSTTSLIITQEQTTSPSYTLTPANIIAAAPPFTINDALIALRIATGIISPTPDQFSRLDIGPISNGISHPDGHIDIQDAVVILRRVIGIDL